MTTRRVAVLWGKGPVAGQVKVARGTLLAPQPCAHGAGDRASFAMHADGAVRLELEIGDARCDAGAEPTTVTVETGEQAFTFLLRDVRRERSIHMPAYGVLVTEGDDTRSYNDIVSEACVPERATALEMMARGAEPDFREAAAQARRQSCPTWLGISRDIRTFWFGFGRERELLPNGWIQPHFHGKTGIDTYTGSPVDFSEELGIHSVHYEFLLGRGESCVQNVSRRLENDCLPVLRGIVDDGDVQYRFTAFAGLESSPLTAANVRGTHFLVADMHGNGHMFTPDQEAEYRTLWQEELSTDHEQTVLCVRAEAVNTASCPRYAWFRAVSPVMDRVIAKAQRGPKPGCDPVYDAATGCHMFGGPSHVFCVSRLEGRPMPEEEMSVMVEPGARVVFEFIMPHRPISAARAAELFSRSFNKRLRECRKFWKAKLDTGAAMELPERRIDRMAKAGLLHLDLVAYGREPDGPVAATIGTMCPIGSESAPILQFLDSMGHHELARRALQYFFEKQHADGFMQNYGGYMLETGPALWSMGEHYRYTRDDAWVRSIERKLLTSCRFLLDWREGSKKEDLRGHGYGLIAGKCADPEDHYRAFMLNGYAYLGLARAAEMLGHVNPAEAERLRRESEAYKQDIRQAFFETVARSPVVPLGDGSWCPSCAPWAEDCGPLSLHVGRQTWATHGAVISRDSLLGPLYLVFQEVLDARERASDWLMNVNTEFWCRHNVAFSQPYYSRHPVLHLLRGEVHAFLKAYYHGLACMADRETYTFWEHIHGGSPHKTHEEGWFLMQTRWMLYKEIGTTLSLLPGIPRVWLKSGKTLRLNNVATYFGPMSLEVVAEKKGASLCATVSCASERGPDRVRVRLPHPGKCRPRAVSGGEYDGKTESVVIDSFEGEAEVKAEF